MVRRRPLCALERYPEQPHHAVGRRVRPRGGVPEAVELRQRQHAGPAGTAPHLRARDSAHFPNRVRRHRHHHRRPLRGQAAQLTERHRVQVRRLDLVHRSAVRHPRLLRGVCRPAGASHQRVSRGRQVRPDLGGRRRCQPAEWAGLLAGRVQALYRRGGHDPPLHPRLRRGGRRRPRVPARRTASAATWTATSGAGGAWGRRGSTACTSSTPTAS